MNLNLDTLAKSAKLARKKHQKTLQYTKPKTWLAVLATWHEQAFQNINCLNCANCCTRISPRFNKTDIVRLAKHLGIKESIFIQTYLREDQDGDWVSKTQPCPFLGPDKQCSIYEQRPKDCANYPYTDSDVFYKRPQTTLANAAICPAAFQILERMSENLNNHT